MKLSRLLFPPRCILCRKFLKDENEFICAKCSALAPFVERQRLKAGVLFLSGNTSVFYYEASVKQAIRSLKYHNKPQYAEAFGILLAKALKDMNRLEPFDIVTWVPASRQRTAKRGYNQAELLARVISKELGIETGALLKRTRKTRPQSGLTPSQRKANVLGAFCAAEGAGLSGKRILLTDDILTTGATASECARVLLEEGGREVYLATAAKTRGK